MSLTNVYVRITTTPIQTYNKSITSKSQFPLPALGPWQGPVTCGLGLLLTQLWSQAGLDSSPAPPSSCAPGGPGECRLVELGKVYNPVCLAEFL